MSRLAILQMGDGPQVECSAHMLRAAGYDEIKVCGGALRSELVAAGLDSVISVERMASLGDDPIHPSIGAATPADVERADLFVEIKCHNVPKLWRRWPRLEGRTAWWRINGGTPWICLRTGDEVYPPCPLITANQWYSIPPYYRPGSTYTFWPPYPRRQEYDAVDRSGLVAYDPPYFLCHRAEALGYEEAGIRGLTALGVRVYGTGTPGGQIPHARVVELARSALALVHLKSVDCAGLALFEAILSGCPVVVPRFFVERTMGHDLLEDEVTCLAVGPPPTDVYGHGPVDVPRCLREVGAALDRLRDPVENRNFGDRLRRRLNTLIWQADLDGPVFADFCRRNFK